LLLRGPQTPGEIRARSGRLHTFVDNEEVVIAANSLVEREGEPMLVKLPRTPGRKDAEYMHLFCGPVDIEAYTANAETTKGARTTSRSNVAELEDRVERLEVEVARLKALLD
jgi:uncharacterized protein YceH (UPF0502 family)